MIPLSDERSACAPSDQRQPLRSDNRYPCSQIAGCSLAVALIALLLVGSAEGGVVGRERVASGLNAPMFATFAPGDSKRLFIAERGTPSENSSATAAIKVLDLETGVMQSTPYLTIPRINNIGEGGVLGLAFHPDFQTNHKFYVSLTANDSVSGTPFSSYIREYSAASATSPTAETTFKPIINWTQPQSNHNGGWIGFSPNDQYLYIMAGDGGNGNDQGSGHTEPGGNAQDTTANFLGKALRIDVNRDDFTEDANRNYGIPFDTDAAPGNHFAPDAPGGENPMGDDEIWAYGLRNPFRTGFDRANGDLWIADVGQNLREEINRQPGNSLGGENYGWRLREGFIETPTVGGPKPTGAVDPVYDYRRPGTTGVDPNFTGVSVFGGVPYRGPDPELQGYYFFGDTSLNRLWMLRPATETTPQEVEFLSPQIPVDEGEPAGPVAITEDAVGNLYITYLYSGDVYRIVTDALTPGDFNADAKVDGDDLAAWRAGFGTVERAEAADGDADRDGDVDGEDFLAWQRNVGWSALNLGSSAPATVIPEPASVAIAALGAFGLFACRSRNPPA